MRARWSWVAGAALLALVIWHTGTGPVVAGVQSLDAPILLLGALLAVPTTVAGAWRWRLVARGLGVELRLGRAVADCYRAQLLNATLPAGVVGDVLRGVRHGRAAGDTSLGLRSVAWERTAGQAVQAAVAVSVLLAVPSVVRSMLPALLVALVAALGLGVVVLGASPRLRADLADLAGQRVWWGVVAASVVVVAGLVTTYVVAARAVGVTAPVAELLPLALLVMVAAGVPTNLAGWGPREGMAAWAFAAAGLGADQGLAASVAFGVMVLVATLPGAVVLLADALHRQWQPAPARPEVATHG